MRDLRGHPTMEHGAATYSWTARLVPRRESSVASAADVDIEPENGYFFAAAAAPAFGRFAPYFERDCLRSLTPCVSSEPRTMW